MLLEKIEAAGIKLAAVDDGLQITGEITDKQLSYLRLYKAELLAELSGRECHMWSYMLDPNVLQYTRMGLMTSDAEEARRQLLEIYGRPVTMLHLSEEPKEITTKTKDGRILITTADGSYLWSLGGGCDFIAKGQDDFEPFPDLDTARAWVKAHIKEEN